MKSREPEISSRRLDVLERRRLLFVHHIVFTTSCSPHRVRSRAVFRDAEFSGFLLLLDLGRDEDDACRGDTGEFA